LTEEDLRLGNLKFISKGEDNEVFGMPIPNELITNNIRNAPYYNAYLEMVAKHDQKIAAKKGGKKKSATAKQLKPKPVKEKLSKPAPAPKPKVTQVKPTKPSPVKHSKMGKCKKFAKSQAHVGGVSIREPVAEATRPLLVVEGKGKAIATEEQAAQSLRTPATEEASTGRSAQPQDDASTNIVRKSLFPANAETGADTDKTNSGVDTEILQIGEEQGDDVANMVNLEEKTVEIDKGQAGSDPVPPLSTSVIDLSPPKPVPSTTQAPIFTATTATTTTTLLAHPQQQSITDSELAARVTALEKKFSNFEQKSNTVDNTTWNIGSRVFTLELQDLPHKINQTVNEVVKEVVHVALQAPLRDSFRELPEADMKEILHQWMFESGTYKSLSEHVALYEALEESMKRANKDEFLAEKDKSRKQRHQARPEWLKPIPKEDRPATLEPDWFCKRIGKKKLSKADLKGPAFKVVRPFYDNNISLQCQMEECHLLLIDQVYLANPKGYRIVPEVSKPFPLGGLPGSKERRSAMSISKLKAANYPDFGLEELVPSLWIESERDYDISTAYVKPDPTCGFSV
ncbi:hypothetical protein Tco_1422285, partial [Tanacetum coccineum]